MSRLFSCVIVAALLTASVYAQEVRKVRHPENWGKNQRVKEALDYWRSWEMAGPDKNIEKARERGLQQFLAMPRPKYFGQFQQSVPAWEQIAASQNNYVSGRATDIAFDPVRFDDEIMYLGTSGGGLWKTTDGGEHWVPISNSFGSYAIGAVAVDPQNGQVVYAATGDMYDRPGDGLYRSQDAGMNWERIASVNEIGDRSNQLHVNPLKTSTLYHSSYGVRISHDGGITWKMAINLDGITSMVIDPTDTNRLYAGGFEQDVEEGVLVRSTDGGNTWSDDLAGNISNKGTITMGISAKDPSRVYASVGHPWGQTIGIARSTDFGATWELRSGEVDNYLGSQSWWCNACAVSPSNANLVIVGGLDIWLSGQGGANPVQKTDWTAESYLSNFTHADIHALKYSHSGKLYAMTDGGIFQSSTNGNSWRQNMNADLGTLLFVGGDAAPDLSYIVGGCQDNGINRAASYETDFIHCDGGDGGRVFVAQSDPSIVFSTQQNVSFKRSMDSGKAGTFANLLSDESPLRSEGTPFYINYDVCETDASFVALCGNRNVYYSEDGGVSLNIITKSTINPSAAHVAGADPQYVYAGTNENGNGNGYVYVTTNAGASWTKSSKRIGRAAGFVTHDTDPSKAWAVSSGYGGTSFWATEDAGKTWTSPAVNLPDLNILTIARAPNGDLFIGHSYGVMRSIDNGVTWEPIRDGLPLCDVRKLRVRGKNNEWLVAATYGRSFYKINIADLPRNPVSVKHSADPNFRIASISPNPAHVGFELNYRIPADSKIIVTLYDDLGREVRTLANEFASAGSHTLRADASGLPAGAYSVVLTAGGRAVTERVVIQR